MSIQETAPVDPPAGPARGEPVLAADHIRLRYPNGALGVHDISMSAARGELIAIFGANGAGKTSTVRSMSGFLKTERARIISGSVTLQGQDVTNTEPHHHVKLGLFFIQERNNIFGNLTVAENLIAIGRLPQRRRRAELLQQVFDLFPVLADRRAQQAGALSGGQRQMLAIGRGIMADPSVLIIDELTLGLHHSLQGPLFHAVRQVADTGVAVLLVDESAGYTLEAADYVYVISGGRVYDEGLPDKFQDNAVLVAGYVEH